MKEETVLAALQVKEDLFGTIQEIVNSDKQLQVFLEFNGERNQTEVAEAAGVGSSTASRAKKKLEELDLIVENEDGNYEKVLTCFDHPLVERLFREEVLEDE